ncbi:beta-galactosidase [Maribellus sp. CM-23]|uniref:sugar-binding domain-containing protein n=1 Tax=Maribellus sp. CM-23 TaxID=2781026 RepID=UPI001F364765|nr:sugar-binding domain-containing protein [Maribellus sp. CM-23]MCE4564607.1 beta-galactosidase [Maribellus sp. CM-23]
MRTLFFYTLIILASFTGCSQRSASTIDLSGEWQFQTDPDDCGINEKWFNSAFQESIQLSGSMAENGKGDDITLDTHWTGGIQNPQWYNDPNYAPYIDTQNIRFPFWLQPEKKYTGAAWYQKKVVVPDNWKEKNITLCLERPHWESRVWINGEFAGTQNSLATPHVYSVSPFLKSGENTLTICIDNRIKDVDVGENSHSISDHTQSNWNGIVGDISLQATGKIYFENVAVFPDAKSKTVRISASVFNSFDKTLPVTFSALTSLKGTNENSAKETWSFELTPGENSLEMNYSQDEEPLLWDEFSSNVYQLNLHLKSGKETDNASVDFGFRDFTPNGSHFTINGRPVFLRGTLECAIFPLTGYPPTETAYWKKIFTAVKAHGLNHVRFHSWCPPKAAFETADEMGVYLQVECSSWANQSTQLGSGFPVDQYIRDESKRIVKAYGNHPSFVMMTYGNEPGGPKYREYLTKFVNYWKENDQRRVYTSAAGWPALSVNQYHNLPAPRIQGWGEQLNSIINAQPPRTDYDWTSKLPADGIPVVSHEIGQWCVYPNFREIEKYTGVLKAKNFEVFRESLKAHHMEELADSFLLASGKLQALCYKADIEAALRTPGFAGFQLLDLHDFPGQGTALVGVLDPFWEEKGYISPEEYRRFCNTTVPLARLPKRVFNEGESLTAAIEVAHFGENPISANPAWKLTEGDKTIAEGTLGQQDISIGNGLQLGEIVYEFQPENRPRKVTLEVNIGDFANSWDCWVYPAQAPPVSKNIRVVNTLDERTIDALKNGEDVLLTTLKGSINAAYGGDIGIGFSSIFWNTAWTGGQKPHTLGILCDPEHPALEQFPTEYHSNWQWWDAMSHSNAIMHEAFSQPLQPIVRVIDDWVTNRQLALLFEARVGKGKLLISGIDLTSDLENRPEARQLKYSLMKYMSSEKFAPVSELAPEEIQKMFN